MSEADKRLRLQAIQAVKHHWQGGVIGLTEGMTTDGCRAPGKDTDRLKELEILAEKVRCTAEQWWSAQSLQQSMEFRVRIDYEMHGLYVQLRDFVLAVPEDRIEVHERYPRDWWQAFRERWFPRWWLRRWPVEYREIDIDVPKFGAVCPHSAAVPFKKHMEFLGFEQAKTKAVWRAARAAFLGEKQTTEDTEE